MSRNRRCRTDGYRRQRLNSVAQPKIDVTSAGRTTMAEADGSVAPMAEAVATKACMARYRVGVEHRSVLEEVAQRRHACYEIS